MGGKRTATIYSSLGVSTLEQLEEAALEHKLSSLPGFGQKIEKTVLRGIQKVQQKGGRFLLREAGEHFCSYKKYLLEHSVFFRVEAAGSLRRAKETVGDLDILVVCEDWGRASEVFCSYPGVSRVISRGQKRLAVVLRSGMQVDMRVTTGEDFGVALHYFTGSKAHNIAGS